MTNWDLSCGALIVTAIIWLVAVLITWNCPSQTTRYKESRERAPAVKPQGVIKLDNVESVGVSADAASLRAPQVEVSRAG